MDTYETTSWSCTGPKNKRHRKRELENYEVCPECGRDRATAEQEEQPNNVSPTLLQFLVGVALIAFLGGLGGWFLYPVLTSSDPASNPNTNPDPPIVNNPDPDPPTTNNSKPNSNSSTTVSNPDDYPWEPDRFTKGQRTLFSWKGNVSRDKGIQAFKNQNYDDAVNFFDKAVTANRNDPEVLILYNNALARQKGNPLTLASVVPVEGKATSAEEMLRGIAMAQNQFNASDGANGRLLEIVIANDGNKPNNAEQVAQQLVNDQSVLGVIGHNSSSASAAGLEIYEPAQLAMISPTSTSTSLDSHVFFRTVPSDAAAGAKLAQHVATNLGFTKAVVFWNPNSSYSESLADAFTSNFKDNFSGAVVKKIDISNPNFNVPGELYPSIFTDNAQAALLFPNTSYTSVAIEIAQANAKIPIAQRLKLLGGDALYTPTTLTAGGEAVENLILAVPWFGESSNSQIFKTDSQNQWGGRVSWRTAKSYDATQAFIAAFSTNQNPDRNSTLKGLEQIQLLSDETSGEALQFTSQGERKSKPILVKATRGAINRPQGSKFGFELVK